MAEKPNLLDIFREMLDDHLGKAEFVQSFEKVVERVEKIDQRTAREVEQIATTLRSLFEDFKNSSSSDVSAFKEELAHLFSQESTKTLQTLSNKLSEVDAKLASVRDGIDADEDAIVARVIEQVQQPVVERVSLNLPALGTAVRDSLELLQGDERLKMEAISGLDAWLEKTVGDIEKRTPARTAGRSAIQLYVDGVKKGPIQTLNIVPGSGITLSHARANGRNDITITGGGGAIAILTATGTVDDSNTNFTFASEPTVVVVNGAAYRTGKGCTISGTSVTLDNPVGTGGDIYALG